MSSEAQNADCGACSLREIPDYDQPFAELRALAVACRSSITAVILASGAARFRWPVVRLRDQCGIAREWAAPNSASLPAGAQAVAARRVGHVAAIRDDILGA